MQNILSKLNQWRIVAGRTVKNNWYGTENKMYKTCTKEIEEELNKHFPKANLILVEDKSGGCGAMFEIYIESKEFKNLTIPKQHKLVYDALKEQIKVIHGLRVVTRII